MKITRIEEQEGVDCEMRNFWKIKHCSSNAFSSTELQSATAVRLCLKYQQQSYDCSHGYAFGVLSCQKLLVLLRFETMLCTLSTNSSKDILNAVVCPCSTILYSMGDSGLSTVHIYTYLIFWCQNVVWLRITCRWICPTSLLHAWKCTTVGCGSFHGQYWTLHTVFRKEKTATSPWSICFVCAAMRAQQPLPLPFRIKIPSIQSSADVSGRVHVAPDLIRLPCALFSLDLSGRRILWRSPRKKTNTDVSTMFGVALGQNSLKAHGEFAPQPNSARPKMWDLTRHVNLICSYLFHFISPRCTRHSRSKYFLQKPGNLCSCTFTLSNHGFSELPALYILYMASESNTKLTAPQGLAAGKFKRTSQRSHKTGIQSSFFKNSGKQIKQISRYPVLEFTHAASWCLILTHSLGLSSLIRLLLSNNTLFQLWASQQYPHEVCQSKSPPSPPNHQGHHGNPSSTTSRFLRDFNAISAISSSNSFEIWWNLLFVHMPAVVLPRLYFLPVPFAFRLPLKLLARLHIHLS